MPDHPTIEALKATAPSAESPLPWTVAGCRLIIDTEGARVASVVMDDDSAHIAAAVNAAPHLLARVAELEAALEAARVELGVCKDMLTQSFAMAFAMGAPPHCTLEEAMVHVVAAPRREVERLQAKLDTAAAVVKEWPVPVHTDACSGWRDPEMNFAGCDCGATEEDAARTTARLALGLEVTNIPAPPHC